VLDYRSQLIDFPSHKRTGGLPCLILKFQIISLYKRRTERLKHERRLNSAVDFNVLNRIFFILPYSFGLL